MRVNEKYDILQGLFLVDRAVSSGKMTTEKGFILQNVRARSLSHIRERERKRERERDRERETERVRALVFE